jgi:hypothetical protein
MPSKTCTRHGCCRRRFRGFFRARYQYHDPTTPVSGAFIETVVTSPGITTGGPITGLPPAAVPDA